MVWIVGGAGSSRPQNGERGAAQRGNRLRGAAMAVPRKRAKSTTSKLADIGDSADIRLRRETVARIIDTSADSEEPVTNESTPTGQRRRERYQRRQGDLSGWSISLVSIAVVGFVGLIGWAASYAPAVFGVGAGSGRAKSAEVAPEEREREKRLEEFKNQLWKESRREEREKEQERQQEEQTRLLQEINKKLGR
jgi:Sec-independent protein translocase protein TatA